MTICKKCGKKSRFASVSAGGLCQECFEAGPQHEPEINDVAADDPSASDDIPVSTSPLDLHAKHDPATLAQLAAKRYRDGYVVARAINGIGGGVKTLGVAIGFLIALAAFIVGSQTTFVFGLAGLVLAAAIAAPVYILGILISTQGQIMKAAMDSAVHTSPFLDTNQKATAMSLK